MIIYTPWPMEEMMNSTAQQNPQYRELEMGGTKILVEQTASDRCRVVRIMSTNPQDYLKAELQPGAELQVVPVIGE